MVLPSIEDKTVMRPGGGIHHIPNPEYAEFWEAFYGYLQKNFSIGSPLHVENISERINPYFGSFGYRFQSTTLTPRYFHLGLDISAKARTDVHAIYDGLLEYSGFGHINGIYVFLSHPEIRTEDGYVMHTLYLHLRNAVVGFTTYEKMLRRISLNNHPNIHIKREQKIGNVGSTGNAEGLHAHLHLQVEFRNEKGKIIVIDPARVLGIEPKQNITGNAETEEEFRQIFSADKEAIRKWGVGNYWKT